MLEAPATPALHAPEVPAAYQAALKKTLQQGRATHKLVVAGNANAVFSQFTEKMAKAVPLEQLKQGFEQGESERMSEKDPD